MTHQPTKGPFEIVRHSHGINVVESYTHKCVAILQGPNRDANTRLFTHGAELVEAAKLAMEYWAHRQQRYENRHPAWVTKTRAIIAKIEGEQS